MCVCMSGGGTTDVADFKVSRQIKRNSLRCNSLISLQLPS